MSRFGLPGFTRRGVLGALAAAPALSVMPALLGAATARAETAPLTSWSEGPAKQAILDFVHATVDPSSRQFVPPEDRVATFDPGWHAVGRASDLHPARLLS